MKSTVLTPRSVGEAAAAALPERDLDYFYWPAIIGENYPPTLNPGSGSGEASYVTLGPFPAVEVRNASSVGLTNATAIWGPLALYRPGMNAFTGFTLTWRINVTSVTAHGEALFDCGPISYLQDPTNVYVQVGSTSASVPAPAPGTWVSFSVTITAAGAFTVLMDGASILAGTATVSANALAPTLSARGANGEGATVAATTIRLSYL